MSDTNVQNHRNNLEFALWAAIVLMLITFYIFAFPIIKLLSPPQLLTDAIVKFKLSNFDFAYKAFILFLLTVYSWASWSTLDLNKLNPKELKRNFILAAVLFLFSGLILLIHPLGIFRYVIYILCNLITGILFTVSLNRYFIYLKLSKKALNMDDKFNDEGEQFEQETRMIGDDKYSIYIPALLTKRNGKNVYTQRTWWNFVNPFAGTMIIGNPGTGKSFVFINEFIRQSILNGFTACIYDYKLGELTDMTYRYLHLYRNILKDKGLDHYKFRVVDFDRPERSSRINPLHPSLIKDPSECKDLATVFMHNINKSWIEKRGDFFPESSVMIVTCLIQFLRYTKLEGKYARLNSGGVPFEGNCSSIAHVIELLNADRNTLFSVLKSHPATRISFAPFAQAVEDQAMEQLSGQVATTQIALSQFATPKMYWALTGHEVAAYVSNPNNPTILCLINNEQRTEVYGPALSMILGQVVKKVNSKNNLPVLLAIDELASVYVKDIDKLIATARSNKVAVLLGFQDIAQLIKDYGKKVADVITNVVGYLVSGKVAGESAKSLQESFGKIKQKRTSVSLSKEGASTSENYQMDYAIPVNKIASLSQGEFVIRFADTVEHQLPIKLAKAKADVLGYFGKLRVENNPEYMKLQRFNDLEKMKFFYPGSDNLYIAGNGKPMNGDPSLIGVNVYYDTIPDKIAIYIKNNEGSWCSMVSNDCYVIGVGMPEEKDTRFVKQDEIEGVEIDIYVDLQNDIPQAYLKDEFYNEVEEVYDVRWQLITEASSIYYKGKGQPDSTLKNARIFLNERKQLFIRNKKNEWDLINHNLPFTTGSTPPDKSKNDLSSFNYYIQVIPFKQDIVWTKINERWEPISMVNKMEEMLNKNFNNVQVEINELLKQEYNNLLSQGLIKAEELS